MENKIKVGITQGDVNGIGLEVIIKCLAEPDMYESFLPIIYGSPKAVAYHRKPIEAPNLSFNNINDTSEAMAKRVNIITCGDDNIHVEYGKSTPEAGQVAFEALQKATEDLKNKKIDVLVTAPINKKNIQNEQFHFPGHTEYLQENLGGQALMLLISENLRVGVVTNHAPIAQVSSLLSVEAIVSKLRILNESLKKDFTIRRPRIAVLGLNPHAGDGGLLGTEEQEIIAPAIEQASNEGIYAMGPYPADGIFGSDALYKFDAILAMYHDQGLAPFKSLAFASGVNYTAGLPFVRTSPDHGTAYDIAGQNLADPTSLRAAIYAAIDIYKSRQLNAELLADPMISRAVNKHERTA